MMLRLSLSLFAAVLVSTLRAQDASRVSTPRMEPSAWVVEQMPGGSVTFADGKMTIRDVAGCTVWLREELTAPVVIRYTATLVGGDRATDRVSDLNCFWMANDSRNPDAPFAATNRRSGKFSEYDSLLTYYVGYGGNNNRTTRFRRYDGTAARPLLPEHDLGAPPFLLKRDHAYRIRLVARDGVAEFWRDDERIFTFRDPQPLRRGWFALRTVRSHIVVSDLTIERLTP